MTPDDRDERAEQIEAQHRERVHHGAWRAGLPCPAPWCERCAADDERRRESIVLDVLGAS